MQDLNHFLKCIGLERHEPTVYLASLRLGSFPASAIARRCNLPRSTARYTCEQLVRKNLMIQIQKGNVRLFTAKGPEKIQCLIDAEQEKLNTQQDIFNNVLQDLKRLHNPNVVLPKITFYEGKEGIITLYDKIIALKAPIYSFEDKGEMPAFIPNYVKNFIKIRQKKKIPNYVVCPSQNKINKSTPEELRETRYFDGTKYPFSWDIKFCKDLVSIFSFDEEAVVGIGIQHKDIARNFKLLFKFVWETLGGKAQASFQE